MEFQIVNEISSFWATLVPPIFLGTLSLLLFLWVAGKENREELMRRFIDKDKRQYVLEKGIYIPKDHATNHAFLHQLLEKLGFDSLRPLMIIFLSVLIFFGINQLLLQIFQPMLIYYPGQLLYSSGVDNYLIADIWMYFPHVQSANQLYAVIMSLTEDSKYTSGMFLYSVEAFIRFDIVCCVIVLIRAVFRIKRPKWVNKTVILRSIALALALVIALAGTLFANIQRVNNETRNRCNIAYSILEEKHDSITDLSRDIQNIKIENYLAVIAADKERYGTDLYYGAFGIKNGFSATITNVAREFLRFFSAQSL